MIFMTKVLRDILAEVSEIREILEILHKQDKASSAEAPKPRIIAYSDEDVAFQEKQLQQRMHRERIRNEE